jgi:hypothetical protein
MVAHDAALEAAWLSLAERLGDRFGAAFASAGLPWGMAAAEAGGHRTARPGRRAVLMRVAGRHLAGEATTSPCASLTEFRQQELG